MAKVRITQRAENEIPVEIVAQSIVDISDGIKKLRSGRLNERALILLIQGACPVQGNSKPLSQKMIRTVLDALTNLKAEYIK